MSVICFAADVLAFAEEVSVCDVEVSHKKCGVRVFYKSVKHECPTTASSKRVQHECPKIVTIVSSKGVLQECQENLPRKTVTQKVSSCSVLQERAKKGCQMRECQVREYPIRAARKSAKKECLTKVSSNSVLQKCQDSVSRKSVPQKCKRRVTYKSAK